MTGKKGSNKITITESSGNIFSDLGLSNSEQELLKAKLLLQIYKTIKERGLTQVQAGEILGIKQPHVSNLMRGQSKAFSVERLMGFLTALGHDIEIAVKAPPPKQSRGIGSLRFKLGEVRLRSV
jgi:predicted XRE-type DNA-binding protein